MCNLRGRWSNFGILSLYVVLILANSADPGEMQHHNAFYLGSYCVLIPVYGFLVYQSVNYHMKSFLGLI